MVTMKQTDLILKNPATTDEKIVFCSGLGMDCFEQFNNSTASNEMDVP